MAPPATLLLVPALLGCQGGLGGGGNGDGSSPGVPMAWVEVGSLAGQPTALAATGTGLVAAIDGALWQSTDGLSWVDRSAAGLPEGRITWLGAMPGQGELLLAWVDGHGLLRGDGADWAPVEQPPTSALLSALNPRVQPVPFDLAGDPADPDVAFLAATGGLYVTRDGGKSWEPVDVSDAGFNLLFTGVAVQGDVVVATAVRPAGVLPDEYAGLLTAGVFRSEDGGEDWEDLDPELEVRWPTGVALDDAGTPWVATMDQGVLKLGKDGWLGMGGPSDAVDIAWSQGGVAVGSARRGVWRLQDARWTATGTDEPAVGLAGSHAIGHQGTVWALEPGVGQPVADGGATVHVALSMHVNLYHSYRGDSNDADGYGIDLDVMRRTLDWLDASPELRADWDLDNYWSVDSDWMVVDGADVLAGIQDRVASGLDDVRLMSWNNGAMSSHTREEFDESIARAWESNLAAFGRVVPGVQPQECMFTPEHVGWYADQGVEWITLFNSATPFSALRSEIDLPSQAWTNPSLVQTDQGSLTLVPVYHHGDLLDHGGLLGWVQQLHEAETEDQLLVIHFDADAESWEAFDQELAPLLDLPHVQFTTIQDYLDTHPATLVVDTPHDVADGNGDGLQSWAEKDFNQRLAARIELSRQLAAAAADLAPTDAAVAELLAQALEPRLLALSTTNFGLAAPTLHPDRVASATAYADQAVALAQQALELAAEGAPLAAGTVEVRNVRDSAGSALVEVALDDGKGGPVVIRDEEGVALATEQADGMVRFVLDLDAGEVRTLSWEPGAAEAQGEVDASELDSVPLLAPFTECGGQAATGSGTAQGKLELGSAMAWRTDAFALDLCDAPGTVQVTRQAWAGLPGVLLEVQAWLGSPTDPELAESVALAPLFCDGGADQLTWQTRGGQVHTRPVRQGVRSWNGQAVDGWLALHCSDGSTVQVSHRATERSSLGLAPLRTVGADAVLVPLGTLWGPAPVADARLTGGLGLGWHTSEAIGSQFRPQAPDWAGAEVRYRLLVGDGDIDAGTLDLFAHPPLVRIGS